MNPSAITPPLSSLASETAPSPRKRGQPLLAWLALLGVVGFILWRHVEKPARDAASWLVPLRMQARYLVGLKSLKFPGPSGKELYTQMSADFKFNTFAKQLRQAVLAGELVGPNEAGEVLRELKEERREGEAEASESEVETAALLRSLYAGYEKDLSTPNLTPEQQETLRERLDWFGDLALAPESGDERARAEAIAPARRTVVGMILLGLVGLLALIAGGALLVVFGCFAALGRLRDRFPVGSGHGGVYVEMFVVYMLIFLGLSYLARQLPERWLALWVQGVAMLLSLVALVWPLLRGLTWRQVCADLGLTVGDEPFTEVACGVGTYLAAVPVFFAGILMTLGLTYLKKRLQQGDPTSDGGPSHPIQGVALTGDWWMWLQVFVLVCVLAPLVEEIMFRGALYRQLREASAGSGRTLSVLLSALASSFVFAVIHPQGWLGVPPLMGLALVFALAREWRGSLVSPMIAHGINNGVTMTLLFVLAS